jgi:hypothetical protein
MKWLRLSALACGASAALLLPMLVRAQGCTNCSTTFVGTDVVHTFTTTGVAGTFTPPSGVTSVQYLVVGAGGGGGGLTNTANVGGAGGGGAGGFKSGTATVSPLTTYTITVGIGGAGGVGGASQSGTGTASSISTIGVTANGGGGGATQGVVNTGDAGASGGGGRLANAGGAGSAGEGNNGGTGNAAGGAGGGGGASAVGGTSGGTAGATGGNGTANSISGASVSYAGGGGGGGFGVAGGAGGSGGGGAGGPAARSAGVNGTPNTGGGGGGATGAATGNAFSGGAGGSGIVAVRYVAPGWFAVATGNWNATTTWSAFGCSGASGATAPPAGANVVICATRTVTVNAATANLGSLTIQNTGTLTIPGNSITVAGATVVAGTLSCTSATNAKTFNGTLTVQSGGIVDLQACLSNFNDATTVESGGTLRFTTNAGGTKTLNDVTIDSGGTWTNTINSAVTITGDLADNGTFTSGTGTYTFSGAAAKTITGTNGGSTSFANLTLNSAGGISLTGTHDLTVTTLLTLTAGKITTNANTVYVSNGSAISSAGGTDFIEGNLKKRVATGANVARTFEVGMGATYCPVTVTFAGVSVAGDITVSCKSGSHPQLATSGLDTVTPAKLNRWWTIANGATSPVTFTTYTAAFTYVAGDIDGGANSAAFIAARFASGGWNATTLSGTPSTTLLTIASETGFGDFPIGEGVAYNINQGSVGRFNAFNTGGPVQGYITTRTAGTGFPLTVVHLTTMGLALQANATFNGRVRIVDASPTGGTFTNNCSSNWTTSLYDSGVVANLFNNQNTITFNVPATITNSFPNARVKIERCTGAGLGTCGAAGGTEVGCSFDAFAIKPASLLLEAFDADWRTAGTVRPLDNTGRVHAASTSGAATPRPFTLQATAFNAAVTPAKTTNYAGNPTIKSGSPACVLPSGCVPATETGTLTVGSWTGVVNTGIRTADSHYSEAGTFNLEIEDTTFAAVDTADTTLSARTISQGSPAPREIGRFVPDRFTLTAGATPPVLQTFGSSCATRSFTYVGQPFWYTTALPSGTVTAVNAAGNVTTNYRGTLFKLTPSGISEAYSNNSVGPAVSCMKNDLTAACTALPSLSAGNGTGTYTAASSGSVLVYTRSGTTPDSPYAANISLTVNATDSSESTGTNTNGNPGSAAGCSGACAALTSPTALVFNGGGSGMAFDSGAEFRYGRVRILNGSGPTTVDVPVTLRAEYYVSAAMGFATNASDNCTSFVPKNFVLSGHQPSLTTVNMVSPTALTNGNMSISGTFASGIATTLKLLKPSPAVTTPGAVKICLDLDSAAGDTTCQAATPANQSFLQGPWSGSSDHDKDPSGQMNLGTFGAQPRNFIFQRENF